MSQTISNKSQAARTRQQQHFYSLLKPFWVLYSEGTKTTRSNLNIKPFVKCYLYTAYSSLIYFKCLLYPHINAMSRVCCSTIFLVLHATKLKKKQQ